MTGRIIDLTEPPSLLREFARAALTAGLRPGAKGELPDTVLRLPRARIDRERLFAYQKLTGFAPTDLLPPTYPHVLAFPVQAKLMTAPKFPLPLPGLIHIGNEITQQVSLYADDEPEITTHAESLRPHPKGTAFDLVTHVRIRGAVAWSSRSTYLHRTYLLSGRGDAEADPGPTVPDVPAALPSARWRLPADLGQRYAAVSGDVNPIHLHPWAARAFGFPRAIAHGMWSLARTLATFGPETQRLHTSRAWFRKPILLPGTVAFVRDPDAPVAAVVSGKDRERVHLVVEVAPD